MKHTDSSKTFDITDRVGRGAGSALLSRTPRDHVRCTEITASETRSVEQAGDVGCSMTVDITDTVAAGCVYSRGARGVCPEPPKAARPWVVHQRRSRSDGPERRLAHHAIYWSRGVLRERFRRASCLAFWRRRETSSRKLLSISRLTASVEG